MGLEGSTGGRRRARGRRGGRHEGLRRREQHRQGPPEQLQVLLELRPTVVDDRGQLELDDPLVGRGGASPGCRRRRERVGGRMRERGWGRRAQGREGLGQHREGREDDRRGHGGLIGLGRSLGTQVDEVGEGATVEVRVRRGWPGRPTRHDLARGAPELMSLLHMSRPAQPLCRPICARSDDLCGQVTRARRQVVEVRKAGRDEPRTRSRRPRTLDGRSTAAKRRNSPNWPAEGAPDGCL